MARLEETLIGRLTGSMGEFTFRRRNGKVYMCRRPKSFTPGHDPESVGRRTRFALAGKLARAIYSVPELLALWRQETGRKASPFNMMVRKNIATLSADSVSGVTSITPGTGFTAVCTGWSASHDSIIVDLSLPAGREWADGNPDTKMKLAYIVSLTDAIDRASPPAAFVGGTSEAEPVRSDTAAHFEASFSAKDSVTMDGYRKRTFLMAVMILDSADVPIGYSATIRA